MCWPASTRRTKHGRRVARQDAPGNGVFVRVRTDSGLKGLGEMGRTAFVLELVEQIIAEQFESMLADEDPGTVERLWQKMCIRSSQWGHRAVVIPIIRSLDTTLWNLVACSVDLDADRERLSTLR